MRVITSWSLELGHLGRGDDLTPGAKDGGRAVEPPGAILADELVHRAERVGALGRANPDVRPLSPGVMCPVFFCALIRFAPTSLSAEREAVGLLFRTTIALVLFAVSSVINLQ